MYFDLAKKTIEEICEEKGFRLVGNEGDNFYSEQGKANYTCIVQNLNKELEQWFIKTQYFVKNEDMETDVFTKMNIELEVFRSIHHPNVVRYIDHKLDELNNNLLLILEFVSFVPPTNKQTRGVARHLGSLIGNLIKMKEKTKETIISEYDEMDKKYFYIDNVMDLGQQIMSALVELHQTPIPDAATIVKEKDLSKKEKDKLMLEYQKIKNDPNVLRAVWVDGKPDNILLMYDKTRDKYLLKITDFGFSRPYVLEIGGNPREGTKSQYHYNGYRDPRLWNAHKAAVFPELSPHCDIYSVAVIMYELIFKEYYMSKEFIDQFAIKDPQPPEYYLPSIRDNYKEKMAKIENSEIMKRNKRLLKFLTLALDPTLEPRLELGNKKEISSNVLELFKNFDGRLTVKAKIEDMKKKFDELPKNTINDIIPFLKQYKSLIDLIKEENNGYLSTACIADFEDIVNRITETYKLLLEKEPILRKKIPTEVLKQCESNSSGPIEWFKKILGYEGKEKEQAFKNLVMQTGARYDRFIDDINTLQEIVDNTIEPEKQLQQLNDPSYVYTPRQ